MNKRILRKKVIVTTERNIRDWNQAYDKEQIPQTHTRGSKVKCIIIASSLLSDNRKRARSRKRTELCSLVPNGRAENNGTVFKKAMLYIHLKISISHYK